MSYRMRVNEIDASPIVSSNTDEIGAMVINSSKGVYRYCQSEKDVIETFGNPSAEYPEVFEAIAFARTAPCHIRAAIHSDALYGGLTTDITPEVLLYMGITALIIGLIIVIYLWLDRGRR